MKNIYLASTKYFKIKIRIKVLIFVTLIIFFSCEKVNTDRELLLVTQNVEDINATGGLASAVIVDMGEAQKLTSYGWCWSTSPSPTIENEKINKGETNRNGIFYTDLKGLNPNTTYYLRPFIEYNTAVVYGEEIDIETKPLEFSLQLPEEYGIYATSYSYQLTWSANISDDLKIELFKDEILVETIVNQIENSGSFEWTISPLIEESNNYRIKLSSVQNSAVYVVSEQFTILHEIPPIITTSNANVISFFEATVTGAILNYGTQSGVIQHGHCWAKTQNPTIDNFKTQFGSTTLIYNFESELENLDYNTTYYVRTYVVSNFGTTYGNELTFTTPNVPTLPFEIELITTGTFPMGCENGQSDCNTNELPLHNVTVNNFFISKNEITNQQYADFLNDYGSNTVKNGEYAGEVMIEPSTGVYDWGLHNNNGVWEAVVGYENFPVLRVSWFGANEFCRFYGANLPTEAEWEYAARGGSHFTDYYTYSGSNNPDLVAWYDENSDLITHEIGTKQANQLSINDMSGSMMEWCADWYASDYYAVSPQNNPQGPGMGTTRVIRGGAWSLPLDYCRVSFRYGSSPTSKFYDIGFRVVLK